MRYDARMREMGTNTAMMFLFLMLTAVSSFAQQKEGQDKLHGSVKNAGVKINYASNINHRAKVEALISTINSAFEELKPRIAPGGERLYFSRLSHPDNTAGETDMEDIWYSNFDAGKGSWSDPARLPGFLNNEGPNYVEQVSITGDTILLGNQYLKNGLMRAGVSFSVNINGEWSAPIPIKIDRYYNLSNHGSHHVSLKKGVIISAIETMETQGQRDLYVSFWNGKKATQPINMGGIINSSLEESSPFLAPDTKTLYFASKGHNGHGGFDIFVSRRLDESWTNWSEPLNMGAAVNGPLDEEFFSISHCGKKAVFSRQITVHNVDLYQIPTQELFLPEESSTGFR